MDINVLIAEMREGLEGVTPGEWAATDFTEDDGPDKFTIAAPSPEILGPGQSGIWPGRVRWNPVAETVEGVNPLLDAAHIARCSPANIAALLDEIERLRAELAGQHMCVNCGKYAPAGHDRTQPLPECVGPDDMAACTFDLTPSEAWQHWSKIAHDLRADNASLTAERDQARDELTTLSCSAGYPLSDQRKCIVELTGALREATALLVRYRMETPLGNQPHMIAHVADDFLARSSKAMETSNGNQ